MRGVEMSLRMALAAARLVVCRHPEACRSRWNAMKAARRGWKHPAAAAAAATSDRSADSYRRAPRSTWAPSRAACAVAATSSTSGSMAG